MNAQIFDPTPCSLGEGPLWHPARQELYWFDITGKKLFRRGSQGAQNWQFDECVSAAGWIDHDTLLIASASALLRFDISAGQSTQIAALEADNPITRSNDGRADPWGGFWIGTMGLQAQSQAGAIYRYWRGELRQLFAPVTIPNAICFSPDHCFGYFADTARGIVWRQKLDEKDGWPVGEPDVFIDFSGTGLNPDGAICDAQGNFWNAQWGASRVACYRPDGTFERALDLPTAHVTCPAFGGTGLDTLYATSARQGLNPADLQNQPDAGKTFVSETDCTGQQEHQIVL